MTDPKIFSQLTTLSPRASTRRMALLTCITNVREMFDALEKDLNNPANMTEASFIGREWQDMLALTVRMALSQLAILTQSGAEDNGIRNPKNPPGSEPQKPSGMGG